MEFRVLGPVEVWRAGRRLPSFAQKPTALLAVGLVDAGRVVSVDRIIDAVWGEEPPATAAKLVQSYVATLRRVLHRPGGAPVIATRPGGYLFQPDTEKLDLQCFQALLERSRRETEHGEYTSAADTLEQALGLWRGPALGGPTSPVLRAEATRLEEIRTAAVEQLLGARLEAGRGAELVGELTRLVSEHPLRERLRALLMVALHRSGRRADALAAYREGRRVLRDELGVEPGRELNELHARLLATDLPDPGRGLPRLSGHPTEADDSKPWAPAQLPAGPAHLTGRRAERRRLLTALNDATRTGGRICVVHGMGGVGKTALALHVAHQVRPAFPDGQLHADLRGADPARAADPSEIVAGFLRALGVRPGHVPDSLSERAALFRTVLANRRVLVVLDDAADEHQVRPLLPGIGGSSALVTSRRSLPGLEASERIGLQVLGTRCTVELLGQLVGSGRIAAERLAAADIARLCGGLPLAVRIAGSRLGTRSRWPLRVLADRLQDEHRRLDEMCSGDLDVRASIAISYRGLSELERLAFRRLGMLGPVDFAPWTGSPLLGIAVPEAERLVERLAEAHLLEPLGPDGTGQVRYRFHDLVRLYAQEQTASSETPDDYRAAIGRLLRVWLTLTGSALRQEATGEAGIAARQWDRAGPETDLAWAGRLLRRPRAWLKAERSILVAGVELACRAGLDGPACELASTLAQASFRVNNQFDEWWRTHDAALTAARQAGNRPSEAALLTGLGQLRYKQDWFAESVAYFREALAIFRQLGDVGGQAAALSGIAVTSRESGHFAVAMASAEQALCGYRETGDTEGIAGLHYETGFIHREQGRFEEAIADLSTALADYREIGSRRGEALTLRSIGIVHRAQGELDDAEEYCLQALRILQAIGDRHMGAYAVQALVKVRFRQVPGSQDAAPLRGALRLCQELDDGFGEALMLRTLGELHLAQGSLERAGAYLERALGCWTQLGLPVCRARTLRDLARLHECLGDLPAARALRLESLETFRQYGTREYGEAAPADDADPAAAARPR